MFLCELMCVEFYKKALYLQNISSQWSIEYTSSLQKSCESMTEKLLVTKGH